MLVDDELAPWTLLLVSHATFDIAIYCGSYLQSCAPATVGDCRYVAPSVARPICLICLELYLTDSFNFESHCGFRPWIIDLYAQPLTGNLSYKSCELTDCRIMNRN